MPQLTIYLDAKAGRLIERAAKLEKLSLSRWAREKLVLAAGAPDLPTGYDSVLGSIRDPSFMIPSEADPSGDQEANFSS